MCKDKTQCYSIPVAQQRSSNSPAINLVSFHFTLLEKKRKKLSEKKKGRFSSATSATPAELNKGFGDEGFWRNDFNRGL